MMKSMTAFGNAEKAGPAGTVTVEIRSFNSRYLDISLRAPHGLLPFEDKVRGLISEKVSRGRIEIMIRLHVEENQTTQFQIDEAKAKDYHAALVKLKDLLDLADTPISLDLIVSAGGIINPLEIEKDYSIFWPVVAECINEAVSDLDRMRTKEGDIIGRDFGRRIDLLEKIISKIENESQDLLLHYRQRLSERVAILTEGIVELDRSRVTQEAALLADRSDISEEIVRVQSHIEQFRKLVSSDAPSGRKLNFLMQELNREFNTIGSKTAKADVAHLVVDAKSELEKIREQVQNIE